MWSSQPTEESRMADNDGFGGFGDEPGTGDDFGFGGNLIDALDDAVAAVSPPSHVFTMPSRSDAPPPGPLARRLPHAVPRGLPPAAAGSLRVGAWLRPRVCGGMHDRPGESLVRVGGEQISVYGKPCPTFAT